MHTVYVWQNSYESYSCNCVITLITEQLAAVPDFANLGPLFKSSSLPVELTESETEYVVRCVKHTYSRYMVFQVGG